ncbi:MAG: hypothetical protein PF489_08020 [Salinivirgaceae bacterium]|jgi:hypothetical protein|nr:hypothetical protein [Salinivirgaceae bacterium]
MVSWNGNTDGIWLSGDNNSATDCFIFNNDDAFMTHGGSNTSITNCVTWGGTRGRLFWHGNDVSSNGFIMDNINAIGKDGSTAAILVDEGSAGVTLSNFTFKNIRMEERIIPNQYNLNKFLILRTDQKSISTWKFENITLDNMLPDEGDLYGLSSSPINGITFTNIKMDYNLHNPYQLLKAKPIRLHSGQGQQASAERWMWHFSKV